MAGKISNKYGFQIVCKYEIEYQCTIINILSCFHDMENNCVNQNVPVAFNGKSQVCHRE